MIFNRIFSIYFFFQRENFCLNEKVLEKNQRRSKTNKIFIYEGVEFKDFLDGEIV